jgi:hypothetical protein
MRNALVIGITGQDGSYLAELLLEKGYQVHGLVRRASSFNTSRIDHIRDRITLHYGDLVDSSSLHAVLRDSRPEEIYNLGAQSHVLISFETPASGDCSRPSAFPGSRHATIRRRPRSSSARRTKSPRPSAHASTRVAHTHVRRPTRST